MSNAITNIIASINTKVKKMQQRNVRLVAENLELRETIFKHLRTIELLNKQLASEDQTKLVNQITSNQNLDKDKIKAKIDSYIKIIDKSIASIKQK